MQLVFVYGPAAAGKLTVARELAALSGLALFHNHLVVDALLALFPFGSAPFVRLRERYWLDAFAEAAESERSLIFTFAPEPTVAADFPARVEELVRKKGGGVIFVRLDVSLQQQERRLAAPSRAAFGKLRSLEILRSLRADFDACLAAMPPPTIAIDTDTTEPQEAARRILAALG